MTTVRQEIASAFSANDLPRHARSRMVNIGSVARFDFTDPYTLNGLANGGNVVDGTILRNLVEGGTGLTATGLSGQVAVSSDGLGLVSTLGGAATTSYLQPGYGEWDMYERGNHDYIWHVWTRLDSSGQSSAVSIIEGRSGQVGNTDVVSPIFGATPSPTTLANGSDGFTYNGFTRSNAVTGTASMPAGAVTTGVTHLISYAHVAGQNSIYLDGVLQASNSAAPSLVPTFRSHATITAGGNVSAGDNVTLNGVAITFVASGATGNQVNIGADAATTIANLRTFINVNSDLLAARAEITPGQANTVLSVLHNGTQLATAPSNPSNGHTITINGVVVTFVTGTPGSNQVQILGSAILTMQALKTFINANNATLAATATGNGVTLGIRGVGRALTLAASNLTIGAANGLLTLTKSAANLTLSSITNPFGYRIFARRLKGKTFALAKDDLTLMGVPPADAVAREFALYRARLNALGIA